MGKTSKTVTSSAGILLLAALLVGCPSQGGREPMDGTDQHAAGANLPDDATSTVDPYGDEEEP